MSLTISLERSLKPTAIEEFLDYYFYRRVAYFFVPFLIRRELTPNTITSLSLFTGLVGAYATFYGHFAWGALICFFAIVLDCCDGMVARLTGSVSVFGRIMDGFFDAIWVTALWLAIYHSGYFQRLHLSIFPLMLASSLSMIVHCWRFDGIKVQYIELCEASFNEGDLDAPTAIRLFCCELKKWRLFSALFALIIAFQMYFFGRGARKKSEPLFVERCQKNKEVLEPVINLWSFLGEGHHNTVVLFGMAMAAVTPIFLIAAFGVILVPLNLWWFYCEYRWRVAMKLITAQQALCSR